MNKLKIGLILILLIFFGHQISLACRCYTPPPPCYAYSQSDAVFIGTVKEIKYLNDNAPLIQTRLVVDKRFKGVESAEVYTETGATSCDFEGYKENRKLLIYGSLYDKDKTHFSTSYCSRSTTFSEDLVDLEFLNSLSDSTPNYLVWGTFSKGYQGAPTQGIKAEVLAGKKSLTAISDNNGNLKITVPKAGKYKVRVYIPTGVDFDISQHPEQLSLLKRTGVYNGKTYLEYEVEVKSDQCGWFDTVIYK